MSSEATLKTEASLRGPLSVGAARKQILAAVPRLGSELVPLQAGVQGRVLAEAVLARQLLPPFDNSAMDGYALRAADVPKVPVRLPVVGEMSAGMAPGAVRVAVGSCAKVMTGAPLPAGADAVVPYEWTDRGVTEVLIHERPRRGNAVRKAGEDLNPGDQVLPAGHRIRATDLAPLVASGASELVVARRPRVALVTTGDEIVPAGSRLLAGQIYDTAGPAVEALLSQAGGEVVHRASLRDDAAEVEAGLTAAAKAADLVITIGGVSMGDYDHVRATVERLGQLRLWRVAMRPGRPLAFGAFGDAVFLGLPGNPVSASVTFLLFGAPCLLAMQGAARTEPLTGMAELLEDVDKPEGLETFSRVVLRPRRGQLPGARLAGNQSSGATLSLARADALVMLPAKGARVEQGSIVPTLAL